MFVNKLVNWENHIFVSTGYSVAVTVRMWFYWCWLFLSLLMQSSKTDGMSWWLLPVHEGLPFSSAIDHHQRSSCFICDDLSQSGIWRFHMRRFLFCIPPFLKIKKIWNQTCIVRARLSAMEYVSSLKFVDTGQRHVALSAAMCFQLRNCRLELSLCSGIVQTPCAVSVVLIWFL